MGHRGRALRAVAAGLLLAAPLPVAAGSVTGRVVFRGEPPALPRVRVVPDRHACGDGAPSEALVVGPRGGVRWAVASLEGPPPATGAGPAEAKLTNRRCRFVPHVLAMQVGTELAVLNEDPVLHNLRARIEGQRDVFNVVLPTQGQESRRTIKRAGVMRVTCDSHPSMLGWILAFEHPFFAVTDGEGRFTIADVPPGAYRLTLWHEGWTVLRLDAAGHPIYAAPRVLSQEIVVPGQGTATAVFELADH